MSKAAVRSYKLESDTTGLALADGNVEKDTAALGNVCHVD